MDFTALLRPCFYSLSSIYQQIQTAKVCLRFDRTETKIPIYIFPEKELRRLSPDFHIHVSVSDFYIPGIGPHIFLQQNRQTLTDT